MWINSSNSSNNLGIALGPKTCWISQRIPPPPPEDTPPKAFWCQGKEIILSIARVSWVDERGHLDLPGMLPEWGSQWVWVYYNRDVNWNSWPLLSFDKSCKARKWTKWYRRRSEQSDAQSRKHSCHVPTEREDIYIYIHIDWMMAGETTQNWRSRPNHEPMLSLSHSWQIQRYKKFAETICPFFWSPRSLCLFKPIVLL